MMNKLFILLNLSQFGEFKVWFAPKASKSKARAMWTHSHQDIQKFHTNQPKDQQPTDQPTDSNHATNIANEYGCGHKMYHI